MIVMFCWVCGLITLAIAKPICRSINSPANEIAHEDELRDEAQSHADEDLRGHADDQFVIA